jgi:hypothetical protein
VWGHDHHDDEQHDTSSTTTTTVPGAGTVITVDEARAATVTVPTWGGTLTARGADGTVYSLRIRRARCSTTPRSP